MHVIPPAENLEFVRHDEDQTADLVFRVIDAESGLAVEDFELFNVAYSVSAQNGVLLLPVSGPTVFYVRKSVARAECESPIEVRRSPGRGELLADHANWRLFCQALDGDEPAQERFFREWKRRAMSFYRRKGFTSDQIDASNRECSCGTTNPVGLVVVEVLPRSGPWAESGLDLDCDQLIIDPHDQVDLVAADAHIVIDHVNTAPFEEPCRDHFPGSSNRHTTSRHPIIVPGDWDTNRDIGSW